MRRDTRDKEMTLWWVLVADDGHWSQASKDRATGLPGWEMSNDPWEMKTDKVNGTWEGPGGTNTLE